VHWSLVVVAKAPIPGEVKTRLCPPLTFGEAADLAAAAFLDTLALAEATVDGDSERLVLAIDGELTEATRGRELVAATRDWRVVQQRGATLGERLVDAHRQAAALRPGHASVQIGMDTPQASPAHVHAAAGQLLCNDAVLGEAYDGGWWLLALRDPHAADVLGAVAMSRATTGLHTRQALQARGCSVGSAAAARDIDGWSDALAAARIAPSSRTAAFVDAVSLRLL